LLITSSLDNSSYYSNNHFEEFVKNLYKDDSANWLNWSNQSNMDIVNVLKIGLANVPKTKENEFEIKLINHFIEFLENPVDLDFSMSDRFKMF
jgi:hypothetical protein